jgi:hypothetical protein
MFYTLSYQMYVHEHGLTAAEQQAADARTGEAAAALRNLGVSLGRAIRTKRSVRPDGGAADAMTTSVRVHSSVR